MDMELGIGTEEVIVGSCNNKTNDVDASHIAKGKRTKRLRPLSPCAVTAGAISSSSSASEEHGSGGGGDDYSSFSSTTTFESTDQEEEDMANCLILLAQGKRVRGDQEDGNIKMREKSSNSTSNNNRRFSEAATTATTATTKIGFYIYECKTCNRTFPSFQALGGHRASHKKPKATPEGKKPQPRPQSPTRLPLVANCKIEETKQGHVMTSPPPISLQLGCGASNNNNKGSNGGINKSNKVHECSICGSEFTSGQALGGHMRRHRASASTISAPQVVDHIKTSGDKPRNVLELDLNLPAPPEDDHHGDSKFHFTATQKTMVLSAAPALVGCHY